MKRYASAEFIVSLLHDDLLSLDTSAAFAYGDLHDKPEGLSGDLNDKPEGLSGDLNDKPEGLSYDFAFLLPAAGRAPFLPCEIRGKFLTFI